MGKPDKTVCKLSSRALGPWQVSLGKVGCTDTRVDVICVHKEVS